MAFGWPIEFTPRLVTWGIQKAGVQFRSPMAGSSESIEFPGAYWRVSVTLPEMTIDEGVAAQAFFSRLAGGVERVAVPYWTRLVPLGTMRGSPVLAASAARGSTAIAITATGSLLRGDMLGIDGRLHQVFADCASVSGTITVPLVNRTRRVIAAGVPVLWQSPTMEALIPSQSNLANFEPGMHAPLAIDMEEA